MGFELALELPDAPVFLSSLLQVIVASLGMFLPHNQAVVTPGQKATQCVAFSPVLMGEEKFAEILEVGEQNDSMSWQLADSFDEASQHRCRWKDKATN